ncbi:MAG: ATP-binding protein [Armatimonadota bacterium]
MSELPTPKPKISVAAGKGGTGKTLLSTSLAIALNEHYPAEVQIIDCDVEEPNAHLLMQPDLETEEPVFVKVPEVDLDTCTRCGICAQTCQFSAIAVIRDAVLTFHDLCAGCGACSYACPVDAITEIDRRVGTVETGTVAGSINFVTGNLNVGDQRATPVTGAVKGHINPDMITILDAPPGTACPMQETVEDTDYCILVTEPTPFGLSNLGDAVETCRTLGVPAGVVINRDGVGDQGVDDYCRKEGIDILLRIPQDRSIAEAYSRGHSLLSAMPEYEDRLVDMFKRIVTAIESGQNKQGVI